MRPLTRSTCVLALLSLGLPLLSQAPPPAPAPAPAPAAAKAPTPAPASLGDQALALLQKKAYAAALPLYEQALAQSPGRPELWNEYAICLRQLRRLPAAARAGWRALQLEGGKTAPLWHAQANTFMEAHEWQAAQACLEKVEALHKDRAFVAKAWLNLAFRMLAADAVEGATEHCRRATRLDPASSLAWIDLGQAQACAGGDDKEVLANLEKGLALAEAQKDTQRAEYAKRLIGKVKGKETLRPPVTVGHSWQTLPTALLRLPEGDARQVGLPARVDHHYILLGGTTLSLSVPETWTESFGKDRPDNQFSVHYAQLGAEGFKVLFSPLSGFGNPLGVQATAKGVARDLLPSSVEKELPLQELSTPTVKGWWVLSTNKQAAPGIPAKGEYRHLLSLQMDVSGQQCVGTVLTNSKAPEIVETCLAVFGSARKAEQATKS